MAWDAVEQAEYMVRHEGVKHFLDTYERTRPEISHEQHEGLSGIERTVWGSIRTVVGGLQAALLNSACEEIPETTAAICGALDCLVKIDHRKRKGMPNP